jgi:hypothetical protein
MATFGPAGFRLDEHAFIVLGGVVYVAGVHERLCGAR